MAVETKICRLIPQNKKKKREKRKKSKLLVHRKVVFVFIRLKIASSPQCPALLPAISLESSFPRISAGSALPLRGLRQLFFCSIISQFCCLDAKKWMTHPSHSTCCLPCDRRDCFLHSDKTDSIHSKTKDHLRRVPTDQVWATAAVMVPSAAPSNVLAAWHWHRH